MATYSSGYCRIKTGSSKVYGIGTQWNVYVSAGQIFKLADESTWYEIAAVNSATQLTLSSRYENTNYQTSRPSEHIATVGAATKIYSGTLDYTPVIRNSVKIKTSVETFTDNGAGVLSGSQGGSGNLSYDDGTWSVTLGTNLTATESMTASYFSGDERTGLLYQIVTDYTTNYEIPEMSTNDINFAHIYTRAMRKIDEKLHTEIGQYSGRFARSFQSGMGVSVY